MRYIKESDAQTAINVEHHKNMQKYCPLVKKNCISTCVCYYPGNIQMSETGDVYYYVYNPGCTNKMFFGR